MRNKTIDMMRALTMVLMVTVNEFWSVDGVPHWMLHAERTEDMLGLSDIVFPTFLFVMGMSIPYAIENKISKGVSGRDIVAHILSRSIALLTMGAFICNQEYGIGEGSGYTRATYLLLMVVGFFLVWNRYPVGMNTVVRRCLRTSGVAVLVGLMLTARSWEGAPFSEYWWGILGLIGWTYLVSAMLYFLFRKSKKMLVGLAVAFLVVDVLMAPTNSAYGEVAILQIPFLNDVLGILHIDNGALCALCMGGVVLSVFTRDFVGAMNGKRVAMLLGCAVALLVAFVIAHHFFIISKLIGTAPWVLAVMALDIVLYVLLSKMTERGWTGWFKWIEPAGTSTLTCYLMPYALYGLILMTGAGWWEFAKEFPVGMLRCLAFAGICVALTWALGKVKIGIKL